MGLWKAFSKDGSIYSEDKRVAYTIRTCDLDRSNLRDQRKKVWDDLERKLKSCFLGHQPGDSEVLAKIKGLLEDFAQDLRNEFVAFRLHAVYHFLPKM